jgi:hypothetical protein
MAPNFQRKEGIDFQDTFAPIVKWCTICIVLALITHKCWKFYHLDVKTIFLNGTSSDEVYIVSQWKGFVIHGQEIKIYKLSNALYGIWQAPWSCMV